MSNTDNTPRFTVWKEYSNIFENYRYILYDGGVYKKGFDDEDEAIRYAAMITELDPKDSRPVFYNNYTYKLIKSWSYVFDAYRFVVYKIRSESGINYYDYVNSFETQNEALDMIHDELYHPELSENKGAPEAEQIFPKQ